MEAFLSLAFWLSIIVGACVVIRHAFKNAVEIEDENMEL
jgi:hypothetical protein